MLEYNPWYFEVVRKTSLLRIQRVKDYSINEQFAESHTGNNTSEGQDKRERTFKESEEQVLIEI
jgi:hypothetical protein